MIALIVLLSGLIAGLLVYWRAAPPVNLSDDVATVDTSKKLRQDIERSTGKMGVVMSGLLDDLQDPATLSAIIVVTALLASGGCFYLARLLELDQGESDAKTGPGT
jgi:hypothetical protein